MDRRLRTLFGIGLVAILLTAGLYLISAYILVGGFDRIEDQETRQNVARAVDALNSELDDLKNTSSDWGNWDDPYNFLEDDDPRFVDSNLTGQALRDLQLNLILYVRTSGSIAAGASYDLANDRPVQVPSRFQNMAGDDPLLQPAADGIRMGTLVLPEGPMLIVCRPVMTSQAEGPSRGTLILAEYITPQLIYRLSDTLHLALTVALTDYAPLPTDFQMAHAALSQVGDVYVRPLDQDKIAGYTLLGDLFGAPALVLRVQTPRPVHAQGQTTMTYIFWTIALFNLLSAASAFLLQERVAATTDKLRMSEERYSLTERLRTSEERYSLAVRGSNDGLWDWNLNTGEVYYSERWKSLLGYGDDEISAHPQEWLDRIHPDDRPHVEADIAQHLKGTTPDLHGEFRIAHRDGGYLWVLCRGLAVRDPDGRARRMAGSLADITARKRAEEQLLHDAMHDPLTGLPNRALFMDRLGLALERSKRAPNRVCAVIFLDLDRFKTVNDSFGHAVGDQLLISCAVRIQMCIRSVDTVARLGGDEFVILLESLESLQDVTRLAKRLLDELALPFDIGGRQIFTSASLGIVWGNVAYEQPDQILRDADIALYRAKAQGRAQYQVFDTEMRDHAAASLELENDLRTAIERREFQLYYQPIVHLTDRRVSGYEALLRWRHPQRGLVLPAEFIPAAEETGLIIPIGAWVLREACRQLREWRATYPALADVAVSINLSAKQFAQPDLPDQVAQTLAEFGLSPENLRLEITESVIMEGPASGSATLGRFREMGIDVQIDDFGTGYSSLSYLQQFPINTLKIDRSFIDRIGSKVNGQGSGTEIVHTIISLAHQLGLDVVAEGVETDEQLAALKVLDCQFVQGYLISKPVPSSAIPELFERLTTLD